MKTFSKMIVVLLCTFFNLHGFTQTESMAVVAADKMNVLYAGIDNPVSIAVPGIPSDKIKVAITDGTITGSNGKYIVKPGRGTAATIEVTAELNPGEITKAGSYVFRVKQIPVPTIYVGKKENETYYLTKEMLLSNPEVNISFDLPIDINYTIVSYTVGCPVKGDWYVVRVTGSKFSDEVIKHINTMETGGLISITNIKIKGPGGEREIDKPILIRIAEEKKPD